MNQKTSARLAFIFISLLLIACVDLAGGFIYHVSVESRRLTGETVEDVFNQTIDDFIYNILMVNIKN